MRKLNVLIGPSSLSAIMGIRWSHADVKHLTRADVEDRDPVLIRYDASSMKRSIAGEPVDNELAELILRLNQDTSCLFLAERERSGFFDGSFLAPVAIANCARLAWSILEEHRPDLLAFHNHPHELFTYVLLKIALHRKVATYLVHFSALPWRMCISRYNTDGSTSKLKLGSAWSEAESESVQSYMRRLQASHEGAIPHGDRALISARRSAFYIGDELRYLLRGSVLKNLMRIFRKWSVYRAFRSAVSDTASVPYVVFLMHYQPEETTMPRGGVFAQQLNAILRLRSLLPQRIAILIKENKATFRAPLVLAMGVRSHDFYTALSSLPNTWLVPLERDTFELIDGALAVATITGSVGLEALCRGKRVVVFGDSNYESFSGVIRLGRDDIGGFPLKRIVEGAAHDPAETRRDLLAELLQSIGPTAENNEINAHSQRIATAQAFDYVGANLERLVRSSDSEPAVALP